MDSVEVLIIDNYDSFTYNLVHLVAAHTGSYRVLRNDAASVDEVMALNPQRILISPGPGRPEQAGITEDVIREAGAEVPILGVCLGQQAIGHAFGGKVVQAPSLMHGKTSSIYHDGKTVYEGLEQGFTATRYHSLVLNEQYLPEAFEITSRTSEGVIMGIRHRECPLEGIQFHPESVLTTAGPELIHNWMNQTLKFSGV